MKTSFHCFTGSTAFRIRSEWSLLLGDIDIDFVHRDSMSGFPPPSTIWTFPVAFAPAIYESFPLMALSADPPSSLV